MGQGYHPEASRHFARMLNSPSSTLKKHINELIIELHDQNVWGELTMLVVAGENDQDSRLDITAYESDLVPVHGGTIDFIADQGWTLTSDYFINDITYGGVKFPSNDWTVAIYDRASRAAHNDYDGAIGHYEHCVTLAETAGGVTVAVTKKLIEQGKIPKDESIVIDGVRFFGATMWTDYELYGNSVAAMNPSANA